MSVVRPPRNPVTRLLAVLLSIAFLAACGGPYDTVDADTMAELMNESIPTSSDLRGTITGDDFTAEAVDQTNELVHAACADLEAGTIATPRIADQVARIDGVRVDVEKLALGLISEACPEQYGLMQQLLLNN